MRYRARRKIQRCWLPWADQVSATTAVEKDTSPASAHRSPKTKAKAKEDPKVGQKEEQKET